MYRFPQTSKTSASGETIEYVTVGHGNPSVVLISGSGGPIEGWHKVFEPISAFSSVFAYNRAGIGGSSKPSAPQRGSHLVNCLRSALQAAGVEPPHVLVAHSFGGLIANLFARLHPSEVSGVVFVEATAPDDPAAMSAHETSVQRFLKSILNRVSPLNPNAEVAQVEATVAELQTAPAFPAIPLTVITGGSYAMAWANSRNALALRAEHQGKLVRMSPLGKQIIAARSGHFPQFSEPEVVIEAVREIATQQ